MTSRRPLRRPGQPPLSRIQDFETNPKISSVSPISSRTPGGVTITIRGFNFRVLADGTKPTVTFDGIPATSVVVVDQFTLTCVNPDHPDPALVDVAVTIGSQTGTAYGVFTFFESVITRVTPPYGPISGGTDVLVEGFNFVNGSLVFFDDDLATDIIFVDSQHITCKTPSHATGFVDVSILEPL